MTLMALDNPSFDMYAGTTQKLAFTVTENGTTAPKNLTGCQMTFNVMSDSGNFVTPLITKNENNGITVIGANYNIMIVTLNASDTAALLAGSNTTVGFTYQAGVLDPSGEPEMVATGAFTLYPNSLTFS